MLAADLFTRLRSPGFCLLRDCTGGGVLGGTGTYLSGHGTLMNCCHHLPTTIVTQNPSTKLTGIKLVKLLQWRTMLSNILQATKTTNIHLFGLKLFFKILRIKSQCFFQKLVFLLAKVLLRDTYLSSIFTSLQYVWVLINGFGCKKSKVIQSLLFVKPQPVDQTYGSIQQSEDNHLLVYQLVHTPLPHPQQLYKATQRSVRHPELVRDRHTACGTRSRG